MKAIANEESTWVPVKYYSGTNWVCEIALGFTTCMFSASAGWVRVGRNGCGVQWTTSEPYFSETSGHHVPFLALPGKNLRFFWLDRRG